MGKKGSILVCDDEEIMRDVLETILSGAGYKVDLAKTGEQAIELYEHRPYDLVLMDVSMPGMGGLTALEHLVRIDSEAAVLMVTAYATFDTAISAWEKGCGGRDPEAVSKRTDTCLDRERDPGPPKRRGA
ncbi:MAG: response regulator [Chloracidobacterium sp.]|nr:response regulator [Chloracidobacterium sp.]